MAAILALVLVGAFVGGFLIVGKWVENVVLQLLFGAIMGVVILVGLGCLLFGIAFAGCLLTNAKMDFR